MAFAPLGDKSAFNLSKMLERDELSASEFGTPRKWNVIDPEVMRKSKHSVFVIVNPTQRKSKQADKAQIKQDYIEFSQNPLIDQEWNTRQRLKASGYDPEEALKKEEPGVPQLDAQMAQMGANNAKQAPMPAMKTPEDVTQANAMQREGMAV